VREARGNAFLSFVVESDGENEEQVFIARAFSLFFVHYFQKLDAVDMLSVLFVVLFVRYVELV
jgi:hypothetical protein